MNQAFNKQGKPIFTTGQTREILVKVGNAKRFNNMHRRLATFFRLTSETGDYAQNWRKKGKYAPALITLTYESNDQWRPNHISKFCDTMRKHALRNWGMKLRYAWVAEIQKRGTIHYHIVTWMPRSQKFPKPSEAGWWKHGRSKIEGVRKGVYGYLLKYITKGCEGLGLTYETKNGKRTKARIFGYGGLPARDRESIAYQMLPKYIKEIFGPIPWGQSIKRVKGGWKSGNVEVVSNWEVIVSPETGARFYNYGAAWTSLPERKPDIYVPF